MNGFVLAHGAWHTPEIWDPVASLLRSRGHPTIVPDIPVYDAEIGAQGYAEVIAEAIDELGAGARTVVVAHTLMGLALPLVPSLRPVERLVYVNCLLPNPGESLREQSSRTPLSDTFDDGRNYDLDARSFWNDFQSFRSRLAADLDPSTAQHAFARLRPQSRRPSREVTPLTTWPDTPSTAIIYRDDADLSLDYLRTAARERLGVTPIELPGSQLGFVADPDAFVDLLLWACRDELGEGSDQASAASSSSP